MKKERDFVVYLQDMLEAITKGISFVKGYDFHEFSKDDKTQYSVVRAIEIIGEASKKIPKIIKDKNLEIPWREIGGMRDKMIHDYFGVDLQVVWKTVRKDFPALKKQIAALLKIYS